eukprot:8636152-Ditylum_brightwellii.AAC.1
MASLLSSSLEVKKDVMTPLTDNSVSDVNSYKEEVPSMISKKQRESKMLYGTDTKHHPTKNNSIEGVNLLAGVKLTGNKEADEDIIAFYKAKEALLAQNCTNI